MSDVQVRFIRLSDRKEFVMGSNSPWRILSNGLKGVDYPNVSVYQEKNASKNGAIITGMRIDDRDIEVKCKTVLTKLNASLRESAISFFRASDRYKIYITYLGKTLWTEGVIEGFSCPSKNIHLPMYLTVKMLCPDPFLKSVDDYGKNIASISAMFGFPYIDAANFPVVVDTFNYAKNVVITNDGDEATYPKIRITFKGECRNPQIKKDETYVRILDTFSAGDVLSIDCESNRIEKNGVNWIQTIDRTSSITDMGISVGDNMLQFGADLGDNNMEVYVYFNKQYLGI